MSYPRFVSEPRSIRKRIKCTKIRHYIRHARRELLKMVYERKRYLREHTKCIETALTHVSHSLLTIRMPYIEHSSSQMRRKEVAVFCDVTYNDKYNVLCLCVKMFLLTPTWPCVTPRMSNVFLSSSSSTFWHMASLKLDHHLIQQLPVQWAASSREHRFAVFV